MNVQFKEPSFRPNYPHVVRYHIFPFGILMGFIHPICHCNNQVDNHFGFCINCNCAIPYENEKDENKSLG